MKNVCVLGDGQLGRMLRQAGEPLGINVYPVGLDAIAEQTPYQNAVITAEIERWPETDLTRALSGQASFINRDVFPLLADRFTQKQLLDQLGLATSPWQRLDNPQQWSDIFNTIGDTVIVKRRTGGYDGRGQWKITHQQPNSLPDDAYGNCIVEKAINFSGEVSLVGAKSQSGQCVFYPLTHNLHQDGILRASVALPEQPEELRLQAQQMLSAIMTELNYVGVMAMECFIVGNRLLINELAPRVHNSGHWTQNGASISQFELHLRAILNLPMPQPDMIGCSVMINLIGIDINPQWLSHPLIHLHWYHKEIRSGRKLGHLNLTHRDRLAIVETLEKCKSLFNDDYQYCLNWSQQLLQK
jgi:5-(carboxyamino)imidazole ribonucleotide synthase